MVIVKEFISGNNGQGRWKYRGRGEMEVEEGKEKR